MRAGQDGETDVEKAAGRIKQQVFIELAKAFLLVALILSALAAWFSHEAFVNSATYKQAHNAEHYRDRLDRFREEWGAEALRTTATFEMGGYLAEQSSQWRRLSMLQTAKSGSLIFPIVLITATDGTVLFRHGPESDHLPRAMAGHDQVAWFFSPELETLYRMYRLPILLDRGTPGSLVLLKPIDNTLLAGMDFPETDLYATWHSKAIASSAGRKGVEQFPNLDGKERVGRDTYRQFDLLFDSSETDGPRLVVRVLTSPVLSTTEIVLSIVGVLGVLALAMWLLLGRWLNSVAGTVSELEQAAQTFSETRVLGPAAQDMLAKGALSGSVEFRQLSTSLLSMMESIIEYHRKMKDHEAELREHAEALKQKNEELERFAYISSHDLQEPLRKVVSFAELLNQRYAGKLDADADRYLRYLSEGANRMSKQIKDLLTYSRLEAREATYVDMDLNEVLEETLADMQLVLSECGAQVTRDLLPKVRADRTFMNSVFQNLISNAVKFRSADPVRIHVSAEREKGAWKVTVQDNGIGIDPLYCEKIFVMFQRLNTREAYPGTGIGLSICKKIIERHGGRIWVEPAPGRGSKFCFTIAGEERL